LHALVLHWGSLQLMYGCVQQAQQARLEQYHQPATHQPASTSKAGKQPRNIQGKGSKAYLLGNAQHPLPAVVVAGRVHVAGRLLA
jgi:hypothetical protein